MANILLVPIFLQLALGIYLKLHIHEETIRPWAVRAHGVVGKAYPIFGWVQMLFGAIAFRGYCRGGNLGQCLAHYIMVRSSYNMLAEVSSYSRSAGQRFHCLRCYHGHHALGWRIVDQTESEKP